MIRRMSSPRLIGRGDELAALASGLDRADGADPSLILVSGEAGVGKSRLVAEFVRIAQAREPAPLVLSGACAPMGDAGAPYGPILLALRSLARRSEDPGDPGAISPAGPPADPRAFERELGLAGGLLASTTRSPGATDTTAGIRMFESLLDLFQRLGRDRTIILVVEDLQWADRSTRELLDFLVRCLRDVRMVVIATVRTDEVDRRHALMPYLAELIRNPHVERIALGALDRDEVRDLVLSITGEGPSDDRLERISSLADGNPFYVEELVSAATGAAVVPASVREIVLARVATLSDAARSVLRLAAVLGRSVDHATLAAVATMDDLTLSQALDETIERGLMDYDSERETYRFRHGLVREAVYADLLPGDRRRSHRACAEALEAGRAGPPSRLLAQIADHYDRSGDAARALEASIAAGEAAERVNAFHEALAHNERALELAQETDSSSIGYERLVERTAEAAHRADEPDRAVELLRGLLADRTDEGDSVRTAALLGRLALSLHDSGDEIGAIDASRSAVELLAGEPDSILQARVLSAHGRILMLQSRPLEAEETCIRAIAVARATGAAAEEASALISLGVSVAGLGRVEQGIERLRSGLAVAEAIGDPQEMARAYLNIDYVYWEVGRLDEALVSTMAGIEALRRLGAEWTWGALLLGSAGEKLFELGRWREAKVLLDRAADRRFRGMAGLALAIDCALLPLNRGDFEAAEALLGHARELGARVVSGSTLSRLWLIIGQLAIWRGRPSEARAAIEQALARFSDEHGTILESVAVGLRSDAELAERARDHRDREGLDDLLADGDRLLARAEREMSEAGDAGIGSTSLRAFLSLAQAEHARLHRRPAAALWTEAAEHFGVIGMILRQAYARFRLTESLLTAGGHRAEAAIALADAHRVAAELGARPLLREVEGLAARARLSVGDRAAASIEAPTREVAPFGLTARELEVLAQLALGRTNRQIAGTLFITEKTAGLHVSNILGKLEVANRLEAAAVAHRLGIVAPVD